MMFMYSSMFIIFGLFLIFFCGTTLSKCNDISSCACIVPNTEANKLIDSVYKGSLKDKVPHIFYIDLCTNVTGKVSESKIKNNDNETGSLCVITSGATKSIELGIVKWSTVSSEPGYKNISISVSSENFPTQTYVNCCTNCIAKFVSNTDHATIYHVPQLQIMDTHEKQLSTNGLSTGSTLVILLFVFSSLYFIGGAILLKLLRGATGWEVLPNHKFWRDLPSLIRDGIAFTFNCCRADSYERI